MSRAGRTVRVVLDGSAEVARDRSYDVVVRPGVLGPDQFAQELMAACGVNAPGALRGVFAIIDGGVPRLIVDAALRSVRAAGGNVSHAVIQPDEPVKSLTTLEGLLIAMTEARLERGDMVVAIGGGIVGDVAGFAAAVYRRGVSVVQCPTTLLSMVDASVGGKTGVNIATAGARGKEGVLKKNMVGAFHQPRRVLADPAVLASLPARQLRAGLAECVKHALLSSDFDDVALGEFLTANMGRFLACDEAALTELVARNVAIKAKVVAGDEREELPPTKSSKDGKPGRMVLNLGHTFGHALETMPGLSPDADAENAPLHHGEAVALGTLAAAHCARAISLADDALVAHVENLLNRAGLPTRLRAIGSAALPTAAQVFEAMQDDKKISGGKLRLVLPVPGGRCTVVENPPIQAVIKGIEAIF